jgi:hypothetical protein
MGVGGQRHAPAALPPVKRRYPLYRRLGGPQGRSGRVRKISPLPEFDPRTVLPVASRYTDWAILAHGLVSIRKVNQGLAGISTCEVDTATVQSVGSWSKQQYFVSKPLQKYS